MAYVDTSIVAVPRDKLDLYMEQARAAGLVWKECGALDYSKFIDINGTADGPTTTFRKAVQIDDGEVAVLTLVTYESEEARDSAMVKGMADPRIQALMADAAFDPQRMVSGGFEVAYKV